MKLLYHFFFKGFAGLVSKKLLLLSLTAFLAVLTTLGQIPNGYYDNASGKSGAELKTALYNIIKGHTDKGYDGLYVIYTTSDNLPSGKVWDMYSIKADGTANYWFNHASADRCGSYSTEGDCYNREHTFCDSWLGKASPQRSDAHHIIPTDGYVNNRRSSFPHGKVGSVSWTSSNGSKLGSSDASTGYTGTVFEPIDQFKGDFARMYFYMATRYENLIAGWVNNGSAKEILAGNTYPAYKTWFKDLMLTWHNLDPVSQKEIDRNNAIYAQQNNRNPYIDHPEYAEMVWGNGTVNVTFASTPTTSVQAGNNYSYSITVTGKPGATFTISAPTKPTWLTLTSTGNGTATITGTPQELNVGSNSVVLRATDGTTTKDQSFSINVSSANQPLQFVSTPVTSVEVGANYTYNVILTGNSGATFTITATTKPSWLTLTSTGNGTVTLSGSPASGNVGANAVVLTGSDGASTVEQSFSINVTEIVTGTSSIETFEKMQDSPINSYIASLSWTGDNNINWSATYARIDQTIIGQAICFKDQTSSLPYLQSQNLTGGCSQIKFKHQQKFSGSGGKITLFVNNTEIGIADVTTNVQTSTFSVTGVPDDFVIKLVSNGATRIAIDDLEWQRATTTPNENPEIVAVTTNPVNPFTGQNISISAEVNDADGTIHAVSMQWGLSSDNLANTISMAESAGLYVAEIPAQNTPTTIHYKINATDNQGGTVSFIGSFNVVVNKAPVISNVSQNPSNPTSANITAISCQVTDTESNLTTVDLLWGLSSTSLSNTVAMSNSAGLFTASIPSQTGGTVVYYAIKAKDSENLEVQSSIFNYTVENATANSRPTISNVLLNPLNPVTGQSISLSASVSDSDGSIKKVIMGWGQTSANDNLVEATLSNSIYSTTIPSQNTAGTVYFKIYAIDNLDDTTKFNSSLTVGVNNLPSITNIIKNPASPSVLDDVTISANVTDPEDRLQSVSLAWGLSEVNLQNVQIMSYSLSRYTGQIPKQAVGVVVYYRIIAKDAENNQGQSDILNYTVLSGNSLPTISNVTVNPSAPLTGQTISISADVTDSDGSVAKVLLNWGSSSTAIENSTEMIPSGNNYLAIIPSQTQAKTIYLKIEAIDNAEDTSYHSLSVSIVANQLPVISNLTQNPANPTSNESVNITANVVDPENRIGTVLIQWGITNNSLSNQVTMTASSSIYTGAIPVQATGTNVFYRIKAFDMEGNQAYSSIMNYTVNPATDINDNQQNKITLYPNPFNETLNVDVISLGLTKIAVLDIIGKVVYAAEFSDKTHTINTSNLKAGIYIVKVLNGGKTSAIRVIKR